MELSPVSICKQRHAIAALSGDLFPWITTCIRVTRAICNKSLHFSVCSKASGISPDRAFPSLYFQCLSGMPSRVSTPVTEGIEGIIQAIYPRSLIQATR